MSLLQFIDKIFDNLNNINEKIDLIVNNTNDMVEKINYLENEIKDIRKNLQQIEINKELQEIKNNIKNELDINISN